MFASHGAQKLFGAFGGMPAGMTIPWYIYWIAAPIEFFGGILIAIGLLTRPVAFLASGLMAFAYFMGHAFGTGSFVFWPKVNQGEVAILYCWLFLYLAAAGPGSFAIDIVAAAVPSERVEDVTCRTLQARRSRRWRRNRLIWSAEATPPVNPRASGESRVIRKPEALPPRRCLPLSRLRR
jgi:putative oxidoreductase